VLAGACEGRYTCSRFLASTLGNTEPPRTTITPNRSYEIHEVAELTGLQTARLRVWERRYEVVRPRRLPNRYRVYSSEQVALLRAFGRLCAAGERIGDLVRESREAVIARAEGRATDGAPLAELLVAVRHLDRDGLTTLLAEHRARLGTPRFGQEIVLPLGEVIGDLWALGKLSVAAEHLASEVVVQQLKLELTAGAGIGPVLLAACLPGEHHEWGFLVTLNELRQRGWRVQYFGSDLPLTDLADAAWTMVPAVVALSGSNPDNVLALLPELRRLPRRLPPGVRVVLGGEGSEANGSRLRRAGLKVGAEAIPAVPLLPPARLAHRS
jgi:DNA-binding transcriptional MerR regulator